MIRILPLLLALLLLASPAHALEAEPDSYANRMDIPVLNSDDKAVEDAMKALYIAEGSGADYDKALAAVQKLADDGNAEAAFRLGRYYDVETVLPDYAKAKALYEKAAEKNHGYALNNLGLMYERGNGVDIDYGKAKDYYTRSSQANDHHGYLNLARLHFLGIGMPRNKDKGFDIMQEAMQKKIGGAFLDMANIYRGGFFGIAPNRQTALDYYRQGSVIGDPDASEHLAFIMLHGDCSKTAGLVAHHKGSADCIPENPRLGIEMLIGLANKGNREAMTDLGSAYWDGTGEEPDGDTAVGWWDKAADLGDCRALKKLADAYIGGKGVQRNQIDALDYLERAAQCNPRDPETLFHLGRYYFAKSNPGRDCAKAERYLQRAVAAGKREAYTDLGYIYDKGCTPIAQDQKKAFGYYLIGAKLGVPLCQSNVGVMLRYGRGVDKDVGKAFAWLNFAAAGGSASARKVLDDFNLLSAKKDRAAGVEYMPTVKQMLQDTAKNHAVAFDGKY